MTEQAEEAEYGRIKIQIQSGESGGFTFRFLDKSTGEVLGEEYISESSRESAKALAVGRAMQLLADFSK